MPILRRLLVVVAGLVGLGGCAISTPYKRGVAVAPTDVVVVAVTYARYRPDQAAEFWRLTNAVQDSLPGQAGYVGHRLRRRLFANEAWTMTVWKDAQALEAFVSSPAHRTAMRATARLVEDAGFARFEVRGADLPLGWEPALTALAEQGRTYERPATP